MRIDQAHLDRVLQADLFQSVSESIVFSEDIMSSKHTPQALDR